MLQARVHAMQQPHGMWRAEVCMQPRHARRCKLRQRHHHADSSQLQRLLPVLSDAAAPAAAAAAAAASFGLLPCSDLLT
jgi:hypothetical protein